MSINNLLLQIRKKNNWIDLYLHKCLTKAQNFLQEFVE